MTIEELQRRIEETYFERDAARGLGGTFMWFMEEVGELATALREGDAAAMEEEFADVMAWLCTLASLSRVRMQDAVKKYADGCPRCRTIPCCCSEKA